jgi:hypothetical protein
MYPPITTTAVQNTNCFISVLRSASSSSIDIH